MHKKLFLLGLFGLLFSQGFTVQDDYIVANIRAYALKSDDASSSGSSSGNKSWGHAWLSIENETNNVQKVSGYPLGPHEGITISVWNNKEPHKGVWISIEQLYPSSKHIATGIISVSKQEFGKISTYIDDHNQWDLLNNCANFTSNIWNLFATKEDQLAAGWVGMPDTLYKSIEKNREHYIGTIYPHNPDSKGYIEDGIFHHYTPDTFIETEIARV